MEEGRKSKADGWKEIEALDKTEGAKEVALLQQQGADLAKQMTAAEQQVVEAAASGDATQLRMAQANLNATKAAYVNVQAEIVKQNADFHKKMESDDAKYVAATQKSYDAMATAVLLAHYGPEHRRGQETWVKPSRNSVSRCWKRLCKSH